MRNEFLFYVFLKVLRLKTNQKRVFWVVAASSLLLFHTKFFDLAENNEIICRNVKGLFKEIVRKWNCFSFLDQPLLIGSNFCFPSSSSNCSDFQTFFKGMIAYLIKDFKFVYIIALEFSIILFFSC